MRRPYIALGLDHQGRQVPTAACKRLQAEESTGICDTVPGDLAPAEELQRDVDCSHLFPLEPFFRRHPTAAFWLVVALSLIGAAIDSPQIWSR